MFDNKLYYNKICKIDKHANRLKCYLDILQSYTEKEMTYNKAIGNVNQIVTDCLKEIKSICEYI